jgi:hypothetical protein
MMAKSMQQQIAAIANKRRLSTENFIKAAVIQAANVAVVKSPVGNPDLWKSPAPAGYTGGNFRANWRLNLNTQNFTIKPTVNYGGVLAYAENDFYGFKLGDTVYFSNPLPYGPRLEYDAWSSQAPDGMVRPAVVALKAALNKGVKDV